MCTPSSEGTIRSIAALAARRDCASPVPTRRLARILQLGAEFVEHLIERVFEGVDLVHHRQRRTLIDAEIAQRALDAFDLLQRVRRGAVDDMDQHVGLLQLLQRRPERGHELGRQLLDEADRVGEQHGLLLGEPPATRGRIERLEQPVAMRARWRWSARSSASTCRRWCSRPARPQRDAARGRACCGAAAGASAPDRGPSSAA